MSLDIISIWHTLHHYAENPPFNEDWLKQSETECDTLTSEKLLLKELQAVEAERWKLLGLAAGWTPYAAVSLSWCLQAQLQDVFDCWDNVFSNRPPDVAHLRPARLLNPALLPKPCLSEIIEVGKTYNAVWLMLACFKGNQVAVTNDLAVEKFKLFNPSLVKLFELDKQ